MDLWENNRGSAHDPGFDSQLAALGIAMPDWDSVAPNIEEVLNGAADEKLDELYPARTSSGLRVILTEVTPRVPALRVAFKVEEVTGKICYVAVDRRQPGLDMLDWGTF
jgi:hypothetical protein